MVVALVVDDDKDTVDSITEFLGIEGIEVCAKAYNGKEGFEAYMDHKPDIVILDMKMPEYDGRYAINMIKKNDPNAKIIVITGYTEYEFAENEVSAVFNKPYDLDKLIGKINALTKS